MVAIIFIPTKVDLIVVLIYSKQLGVMQNSNPAVMEIMTPQKKQKTFHSFLLLLYKLKSMSKHGVFKDENYLPDGYVAAKRINCLDYDHDTLHAIINEHCIVKGQPIVVSNMNKSPNWDSRIFTLNKLKEYRGDLGTRKKTNAACSIKLTLIL
jgi:hypothetical protein